MYRFLDRPVRDLDPAARKLLWAMRTWIAASAGGRCPCASLGPIFASWRISDGLSDFDMAMHIVSREGLDRLVFAPVRCWRVHDDEARLLALFAAVGANEPIAANRIAASLVQPEAMGNFRIAVARFTASLPSLAASSAPFASGRKGGEA